MFFKVPSPIIEPSAPASGQSASETAAAAVGDVDANYRRRVAAACDRCRLKKARCSGGPAPCIKCRRDRVICIISKDKKLDTQPKSPAYVRMVESQRDLLLKAVRELREKNLVLQHSNTQWDASSDINRVLQELGVHADESGDVRDSIMEEIATPQSSSQDCSQDLQDFNPQTFPWLKDTSTQAPVALHLSHPQVQGMNAAVNGGVLDADNPLTAPVYDTMFDGSSHFDQNAFETQWASSSNDPYFGFQDSSDFGFGNMETIQQQTWQNGNMPTDAMGNVH